MFWSYRENPRDHRFNTFNDCDSADNILAELTAGSIVTQVIIKNTLFSYKKVSFEGCSGNIALFHGGNIPQQRVLRVRVSDIAAIII